jgi:hypothetical protein
MNKRKIRNLILLCLAGVVLAYVAMVAWNEYQLGTRQPQGGFTIVIATFDKDNNRHERVVRLTRLDGENYIAAQHWPRAWYRQALANPEIEVKFEESFEPYLAVSPEGAELERVKVGYPMSFGFKFRTGFPPRRFLRLDPR